MYVLKRIGQAIVTFLAVVTITFVMIRQVPGGPKDFIMAQQMANRGDTREITPDQINQMVVEYTSVNPDQPLHLQYLEYMGNLMQGKLGKSVIVHPDEPVANIILEALPWTMFLLTVSIMLTFAIGVVLGAVLAYLEGTKVDAGGTGVSMFLNSVPYYIFALASIYFLAHQLDWFPASNAVSSGRQMPSSIFGITPVFVHDVAYHAALPVFSLVATGFGGVALTMRGNAIQEIGEDYVRVARLRGLPTKRIAIRYVGRNAFLPMYTSMLIAVGFMFGGAVILEEIFGYQGIGWYLIRGVQSNDYPLLMGCFLVITTAVVVCIFVADLTYGLIDPRVGDEGSREAY